MKIVEMVIEPQRETPITGKADTVVVGGGPAGIGAAVAAARNGAKVILIERSQCLGGTATSGLMVQMNRAEYGIAKEFQERMAKLGGAVVSQKHMIVPFEPETFKCVADEMTVEAGVSPLMETVFADAIVENNAIDGVIVQTKAGRQAVLGDVVVDASGDGDVAAAAGAPYILGRTEDNLMQPFALLFRMGNVDIDKLVSYMREHPDQFTSQDPSTHIVAPEDKIIRVQGFFDAMEEAIRKGELDPTIRYVRLDGVNVDTGTVVFNTTRVYRVNGTRSEDLTRANILARRQMMQLVNFAKKYMPGFENSYLDISASYIGVRETRHIVGEYMMTYEDIVEKRRHSDAIFVNKVIGYPEKEAVGHYPSRILEGSKEDVYTRERARQSIGIAYIPYRCLVPKKIDGLLLAGRNISADHYATNKGGGGRNILPAMLLGQVAGTAAALSVKDDVIPKNLDVRKLQRTLVEQGFRIEGV